jgi:hypothetical protein
LQHRAAVLLEVLLHHHLGSTDQAKVDNKRKQDEVCDNRIKELTAE